MFVVTVGKLEIVNGREMSKEFAPFSTDGEEIVICNV